MNQSKKGSGIKFCDVCQLNIATEAEFALHEFTKKHCDNLLKLAKNKPVTSKLKTAKSELSQEKEVPPVNVVTTYGSFAKYGYFVPGEVYQTKETPKEFNVEYDPYLQKFAENPFKEKKEVPNNPVTFDTSAIPTVNVTSFSKKKKKKIRSCQICNVTLTTVPEYEAHMRSPLHTWKLKMSGMGVSAHFVKASTDLHTTDINEDSTSNEPPETETPDNAISPDTATTAAAATAFPTLYCDVCELLLNSEQQYNSHVSGKSHNDMVQKKADLKAKKEKQQNPSPNQLYCYSCKLSLNNLFQYNEHKNGKKHKAKCRQLMKEGFTIPPEERVPSWDSPRSTFNKPVVYPELYEKCVLEPQRQKEAEKSSGATEIMEAECNEKIEQSTLTVTCESTGQPVAINMTDGMYHCDICSLKFNTASKFEFHVKSNDHCLKSQNGKENLTQISDFKEESKMTEGIKQSQKEKLSNDKIIPVAKPSIIFHTQKNEPSSQINQLIQHNQNNVLKAEESLDKDISKNSAGKIEQESDASMETQGGILLEEKLLPEQKEVDFLKCNICNQTFKIQPTFESHLNSEDHAKNIIELRNKGTPDNEILCILHSDRIVVKPDKFGRYSCGICNVTSSNKMEYNQHISSIVHKYADIDYKKKRAIEIRSAVVVNEEGKFVCKLCEESFGNVLEYNQHLHSVKHRNIQREKRAQKLALRKRTILLQQKRLQHKYFVSGCKRDLRLWKKNCEKNPGVRTKIGGIAMDLYTGEMAPIPNLEPLEPKIDPAKNVNIGVSKTPSEAQKVVETKKPKKKLKSKPRKATKKLKKLPGSSGPNNQCSSQGEIHNPDIPSLLCAQNVYPLPTNIPPPVPQTWPLPGPAFRPGRDWVAHRMNFHPYRMAPFNVRGRPPFSSNSYPPRFQRSPWSRCPPRFGHP